MAASRQYKVAREAQRTRETGRQEIRRLEGEARQSMSYEAIDAFHAKNKAEAERKWSAFQAVANALEVGEVPDPEHADGAGEWIEYMNGNVPHWVKWDDRLAYERTERMVRMYLRELHTVLKVG